MSDYPLLHNLVGSYLHQDYDIFAPNPRAAFLLGVEESYLDRLPALVKELETLEALLLRLDLTGGREILRSLGSEINVAALGHTPATWVAELTQDVRRLVEGY